MRQEPTTSMTSPETPLPPPRTGAPFPATPFDAYRGLALRGRRGAWRVVSAVVLIVSFVIAGTLVGSLPAAALYGDGAIDRAPRDAVEAFILQLGPTLFGVAAALPGMAIAMRVLHDRPLKDLLGVERRLNASALFIGGAAALILNGFGVVVALALGWIEVAPRALSGAWAAVALAAALLVPFQAAAEEIFFRGYLLQRIAARAPHPLAWAVLPSAIFGLLHLGGDGGAYEWGYVAATFTFGLLASIVVWRTGGLSHVIGFHVANNLFALVLLEPPFGVPGVGALEVSIVEAATPWVIAMEIVVLTAALLALTWFARPECPPGGAATAPREDEGEVGSSGHAT